jgi:transcription termination factor Rho
MDDQDPKIGELNVANPIKKGRKPATKRARPDSSPDNQGDATVVNEASETRSIDSEAGGESKSIKRGRSRRGQVSEGEASSPDLFGVDTTDASTPPPLPVSAPELRDIRSGDMNYDLDNGIKGGGADSELTDEPAQRPVFSPSQRSEADPHSQGGAAFESLEDSAISPAASTLASQETNIEPGRHSDNTAATTRHADEGGAVAAGAIDDRKPWWERKKEKKKQKWLEKQQSRSAHGGHSGHVGGAHGGQQGGGSDRPPQQPPPPAFAPQIGALPEKAQHADAAALDLLADELAKDEAPLELSEIHASGAAELLPRLRALGEAPVGAPSRRSLVEMVFAWAAREKRAFHERGWLDVTDAGFGFIVHSANSYRLYPESTCVPAALIRRHGLRRGQELEVIVQPPQPGERCPVAVRVLSVMSVAPEKAREATLFEELIPYYPLSRILLEAPEIHKDISMRAIDLLTPVGFGQRGLIVAPPRTGKTVLLQNIANSISHNFPESTLILLLIDERPEEVTDFRRHTKGEVVSSTFDEAPESHVHAAEMVIEKARRLVELGKHVVILLDSITRLARAYNAIAGNGGKTMSGGIESNALQRPKRFFGSARNIEGGGSLTILGTALVDTGSRMDEVIFEEFKGTGNMELHLDRGLSDKRIFPAINIDRSGTRKEELIYHPEEMLRVYGLRRAMQGIPAIEAMDMFIQRLKKTRTNAEFLLSLNR